MELNTFIYLIKTKLTTVLIFMGLFFVVGLGLTLVQPLKYSSSLRLLVVQDASGAVDPYTTTRANEYLSEILSKVSYSTSFLNQVLGTGLGVDASYFGNTNKKMAKTWAKTIDVKPVANTGIIAVTAYHPNRDQAERIARAVGNILITQNGNYHGLGDKVAIKLLDEPITSSYPVKPNLLINAGLSLLLGLIFALSFIYLFPEATLFERRALAATDWQAEDSQLNQFNLHQQPEAAENYRLVEEALPFDFVAPTASKPDWHQEF